MEASAGSSKPKEPISDWALIGVYLFNDKVFDAVKQIKPSWRGELEITDTIQILLETGARVEVQKVQGWWKDTGKPEDLLEANQLILQELQPYNHGKVEETASLTNNVGVGEGTVIHGRTTIRGPVIIGEHRDRPKHLHRPLHQHRRPRHHPKHGDREHHHYERRTHRLRETHHRQPHRQKSSDSQQREQAT
jgi:dTDP-glucose pyrophosphorylase